MRLWSYTQETAVIYSWFQPGLPWEPRRSMNTHRNTHTHMQIPLHITHRSNPRGVVSANTQCYTPGGSCVACSITSVIERLPLISLHLWKLFHCWKSLSVHEIWNRQQKCKFDPFPVTTQSHNQTIWDKKINNNFTCDYFIVENNGKKKKKTRTSFLFLHDLFIIVISSGCRMKHYKIFFK